MAQRRFEFENSISDEDLFTWDQAKIDDILVNKRPWKKDPHYFKHCKISAVALIKMVMHAKAGDEMEVMGCMQGFPVGETMYVLDVIPLPEEGTETRVSTSEKGEQYLINHIDVSESVARPENVVGWYHSHPGYGCWLSGIDVQTQQQKQMIEDPALAIVVDPKMTMSAGKVEIGVFRAYSNDYAEKLKTTQAIAGASSMPADKFQDFGLHAHKYYKVEHSFFKTGMDTELLDRLWNEYWLHTLSHSPLLTNQATICQTLVNVVQKLKSINFAEGGSQSRSNYRGAQRNDTRQQQFGGGRTDKVRLRKAMKELEPIQASCLDVTGQVNQGVIVEALKNQMFTTPE